MIIAFTGHRPNKLGGYNTPNPIYNFVTTQIERVLLEQKPEKVITGMALGVDTWAADIALKLNIPFIAAVPFIGQENIWPKESKENYLRLLDNADQIEYVCQPGYSAWKLQRRNEWMVDHADKIIAVWDGTSGGTANCVAYAKEQKKNIIQIDPTQFDSNLAKVFGPIEHSVPDVNDFDASLLNGLFDD